MSKNFSYISRYFIPNKFNCAGIYTLPTMCLRTLQVIMRVGREHSKESVNPDWYGSVGWVSSVNQKLAAGLIPGLGTCLDCGPDPWLGCMREAID